MYALRNLLVGVMVVIAFLTEHSEQYGTGAPATACQTMLPRHEDIKPQITEAPYTLKAAGSQVAQGSQINVVLSSPLGKPIRGFLLQARSNQNASAILGSWTTIPELTRISECEGSKDSVTHTNTSEKANLVFTWTAPTDFLGAVVFRATSAEKYDVFWANVTSTLVEVVAAGTIVSSSPLDKPTTQFVPTTTRAPIIKDPFYDGCDSSKLCFGSTPGCLTNNDCRAAVTVLVEGETYTFELKGKNAAYVAVGLSTDKLMGGDSVMECTQENNDIKLYTSWTYPKSDPYVSRENVPQSIVQLVSKSYIEGVIQCKFTRDMISNVRQTPYNLASDKYNLLIVAGSSLKENSVGYHDIVYTSNDQKVSLSEVGSLAGASKVLLRLHGAFMLIAWIGTASCGIILARYYRQTWVGKQLGGKDIWFAWHRILMVSTWVLTMAGFVIILIEIKGWAGTGDNPHAIIGIVTIVLCFIQPIGAYFRPHPNTSKRPIFNWVHWFFGNVAHILGIVTIFFAVYLNKAELPGWMAYILVAFVAFNVIVHLILSVSMCVSDGRISNGRVNSFPMKDMMTNNRQALNHDRKTDAPHSGFRKLLLGIVLTVIILFVIALVCIICLAPIEQTYDDVSKAISGVMGSNDKN